MRFMFKTLVAFALLSQALSSHTARAHAQQSDVRSLASIQASLRTGPLTLNSARYWGRQSESDARIATQNAVGGVGCARESVVRIRD